jgi:hypothetical protein
MPPPACFYGALHTPFDTARRLGVLGGDKWCHLPVSVHLEMPAKARQDRWCQMVSDCQID